MFWLWSPKYSLQRLSETRLGRSKMDKTAKKEEGKSKRLPSKLNEAVKKRRGILGTFTTCLKLEDVKTAQKVGGEGFSNPCEMKLKSKLNGF